MNDKICYIVGAGEMDDIELHIIEGGLLIAADGGYDFLSKKHLVPDVVIGDFDSITVKNIGTDAAFEVIRLPREKDDTDMLAAIKEGLRRGYFDFHIYGGTGGRLDHTLANIQCLIYLYRQGARGYLFDRASVMTILENDTIYFDSGCRGRLSLFCMGDSAEGVSIIGLQYPLDNVHLTNSYAIGISNEFLGTQGSITVKRGTLLLMAEDIGVFRHGNETE